MTIAELTAVPRYRRGRAPSSESVRHEFVLLGILADGHVLIEDFPASPRR
jgi:hypothetical protein